MKFRLRFIFIFLVLVADLAQAAVESRLLCSDVFNGVPGYLDALQAYETGPASLETSEDVIQSTFTRLMDTARAESGLDNDIPAAQKILFRQFKRAVSYYVVGRDDQARASIEDLRQTALALNLKFPNSSQMWKIVAETADEPKVTRAITMAPYFQRGLFSVETHYFTLPRDQPSLTQLAWTGTSSYTGATIGGPRQAEMVRAFLQYSQTQPGDRVLELGYGTPAVMLGIWGFVDRLKYVGIDPTSIPQRAPDILAPFGIELIEGCFPDTISSYQQVMEAGPYSVIYGLDAVKRRPPILQTATPPDVYLRRIYGLLKEGGLLILMNDYRGIPYFSRKQAEEAGFTVVRWAAPRIIPPRLRQYIPYRPQQIYRGELSLYVLRRGEPLFTRMF